MEKCDRRNFERDTMKILIITDGIFPFVIGGMQKHSYYLTKWLVRLGEQVTLVHCVPHGKKLPTHQEVLSGMELEATDTFESVAIHFPMPGVIPGHYLKESYLYSKQVYNKLKSRLQEFDFVYAKGFSAWHLLYEKQTNKSLPPVGVKFHGYEMFQKPPSFKARLQNFLLKPPVKWNNLHADYVFSYGSKITDIVLGIGVDRKRIIEIPTGIDASWIRTSLTNNTKLEFVFLGRYERRKGIDELNKALQIVLQQYDIHFHFIGPIPPSKRIVSDKITYHGTIMESERIKSVMDDCQVLVAPSHSEGMPNVIMEGMARGMAILTTPVGAIESVVDRSNGWLVIPADSSSILTTLKEIVEMSSSGLLAKRENSLKKIRYFIWENIASQTQHEIAKVLSDITFARK